MNTEELEKVLSRVAELVDSRKNDLLRGTAEPEEGMPSDLLKQYSKGELVAEIVYLEFTGRWRNRVTWY